MKKEQLHINKGFSLVEILIAISIFLIIVISITDVSKNFARNAKHVANSERAVVLAEESIEITRNLRDSSDGFANLPDGTHGLVSSGSVWNISGSSDTQGIFTRSTTVTTISPTQKKVDVNITWSDSVSAINSVSTSTYLTTWREVLNTGVGLTVNSIVINHGGTKVASDFAPYKVGITTVDLGVANLFEDGTYVVSETLDPNYTTTFSGDCDSGGSITINNNATTSCVITNEEKLSYLTVNKNVINHGGTKVATDFTLNVDSNPVVIGATNYFNSGVHTVSEVYDPDYSTTFSGDCDSSGSVTLVPGTTKVCTITNEEITLIPTVSTPTVTNITTTTATLGANVTSLGNPASISSRGTCWGTTPLPTTNCIAEGGTTTGVFTQSRSGFTAGTLYYYRGYATNSAGTGYSADGTFTSKSICLPSLVGSPTLYDNSISSSGLVNKPTGVVSGDIMFAHIMHSNPLDQLNTIPTGWVSVGRHLSGSSNQALYYKVAGASEGSSYTFGFNIKVKVAITISAYRGCFNTISPIDVVSNTEYIVNNTTYRAASMNLPSADTAVIIFPSMSTNTVRTFLNPTTQSGGWTEDYDHGSTASDFSRATYRKFISGLGSTGVIDSIGTTGSTVKHAFAVGLKPL